MSEERDPWESYAFDAEGRLVDTAGPVEPITWGEPPAMRWVPIVDVPKALGKRLALMTKDGPVFDHRAVSEVFSDGTQGSYVYVAHDVQWWDWVHEHPSTRPPRVPRATTWSTRHVWVEVAA